MKALTHPEALRGQRQILFPSHVAEIRLSYSSKISDADRLKVTSSSDAHDVFRARWKKSRIGYIEEFKALLLNRANLVLGVINISLGGVSGCVADPKVIYAAALKANASGLLVAHNHPSGNLIPSQADIQLTRKLKNAGEFLDLPLLDHLIITKDGSYYSFADEGML